MENKTEQLKKEYAEFIELAAHDLDAPLRKLSVLVERVTNKYRDQDEEIKPYIGRIDACLNDMRTMIDGLAMISRFSSDPMQISNCNLNTLVKDVVQELNPLIKEKQAAINLDALPEIKGDEIQLRQLFKNLLQNSLCFTKSESPKISFDAHPSTIKEKAERRLDPARDFFTITITDNGIGFKQEYAEQIFRPFVRLHGKSEYPGKGLGLAICRKIAENHEGTIYAESNGNDGARFILILPQTLE